jgi:hypothetical protein
MTRLHTFIRRHLVGIAIIALFAAFLALMGPNVVKGWEVCTGGNPPAQCPELGER